MLCFFFTLDILLICKCMRMWLKLISARIQGETFLIKTAFHTPKISIIFNKNDKKIKLAQYKSILRTGSIWGKQFLDMSMNWLWYA